jgi:predicted esterase
MPGIDYRKTLTKLMKLIHGAYGIAPAIVVGGYSQGGTLALDIATRYQDRALGSVIVVGSGVFDNNPSVLDNPKGDRRPMRIRTILGKNDIWFPEESVMKNINKVASNYKLTKVGKWPEILDSGHMIFDDDGR